jgi:flagellar hook-length control protein FliK
MVGGVATTQVENPVNQAIEPDRLAEAQTTNIIGQIARQMEKLTQTGRQTLRIQLYPHELGHIDLKITSTSQGVGVTMLADNPVTGKLLEGQMAQLRQNLTDAGIQIANMQIGTQSNQQPNQGTFQNPNQTPARYAAPTVSSEVTGGEPARLIESLIDYKI